MSASRHCIIIRNPLAVLGTEASQYLGTRFHTCFHRLACTHSGHCAARLERPNSRTWCSVYSSICCSVSCCPRRRGNRESRLARRTPISRVRLGIDNLGTPGARVTPVHSRLERVESYRILQNPTATLSTRELPTPRGCPRHEGVARAGPPSNVRPDFLIFSRALSKYLPVPDLLRCS